MANNEESKIFMRQWILGQESEEVVIGRHSMPAEKEEKTRIQSGVNGLIYWMTIGWSQFFQRDFEESHGEVRIH